MALGRKISSLKKKGKGKKSRGRKREWGKEYMRLLTGQLVF